MNPETGEYRTWGELPGDQQNPPIQPADILELASYGEKTPSGAGFRVILKAGVPVPTGKKCDVGERNPLTGKVPGVEMYSSGRFFTFTGDHITGTPNTVELRTAEALELHSKLHPKPTSVPPTKPASNKSLDTIEQLAMDLCEGRTGSRNNLMFAISGILIQLGWKRNNIETLLKYLRTQTPPLRHETCSKLMLLPSEWNTVAASCRSVLGAAPRPDFPREFGPPLWWRGPDHLDRGRDRHSRRFTFHAGYRGQPLAQRVRAG